MTEKTVWLRREPGETGDIRIAVGASADITASPSEIDVSWNERGMLTISFPEEKRQIPLQCVVNGEFSDQSIEGQ